MSSDASEVPIGFVACPWCRERCTVTAVQSPDGSAWRVQHRERGEVVRLFYPGLWQEKLFLLFEMQEWLCQTHNYEGRLAVVD